MSSHYIVTFKKTTPDDVIEKHIKDSQDAGCTIKHRYNAAIKGYSVEVPDDSLHALAVNEHVNFIEADGEVSTQGQAKLTQ
ncbi:hypothetical protein BC940DRAFT_68039 [Gongronella butleri]|nr:hypothetical protein BC940DRAFT_68039 [Gongronella butleri]